MLRGEELAPLHIGIVGCSAEGAALCYRTICLEAPALLGGHAHPEVTLHTPSLAAYTACLEAGDLEGVAALMLRSAEVLAGAGADFLIAPDNTIHQALPLVLPKSPLPWLSIAEVVADAVAAAGHRQILVTGTRWLVRSDVYPAVLASRGVETIRPDDPAVQEIDRIIMDELVRGTVTKAARRYFQGVLEQAGKAGATGVILGCTELPLLVNDDWAGMPTFDSTRLLARAALARSLAPPMTEPPGMERG